MNLLKEINFLLSITRSEKIIRRYFVVNGFDGALTMLGLIIGFIVSVPTELPIIINACLGAAIALGMSGISSAYISESAELQYELGKLEQAMVSDLQESAHGKAARLTPLLIALVNGSAPLFISLLIIMPLWLSNSGVSMPISPLHAAISVASILIFMLGVFLGRISGVSWIRSGIQTLVIATATTMLIYLFASN